MAQAQAQPRDVLFSPSQVSTLGKTHLEKRRQDALDGKVGVLLGVPSVDTDLLPAIGGELITIIGRPGHGKSSVMMAWARYAAREIVRLNENMGVLYITTEQSIEELFSFQAAAETNIPITSFARGKIGDDEWERVIQMAVTSSALPLYFIGHSQDNRKKRPQLTADFAAQAALIMESEMGVKPKIIFADYLQRFKMPRGAENRVVGTSDTIDRFKDLALEADAPVVLGVQARREVDESKYKIPEMDDGQWSSNVEQSSDKSMSVVRPIRYVKEGEVFEGLKVEGYTQCLIKVLKQKMGPAPFTKWVSLTPELNRLAELELKYYDPRKDPHGTQPKSRVLG